MKKLILLSVLIIVGCDLFESEDEITGWLCKLRTECFSPTDSTIIDCPLQVPPPEGMGTIIDTTTIYSSFEGCDSVCVKHGEIIGEGIVDFSPYYCRETN